MITAVVTVTLGPHTHLDLQQRSLALGRRVPDVYVVVTDDRTVADWWPAAPPYPHVVTCGRGCDAPGDDRPWEVGMAAAVDLGAELLIGLDPDCLAGPELVSGYATAVLRSPDAVVRGAVTVLPPPPPRGYAVDDLTAHDRHGYAARPTDARKTPTHGTDGGLLGSSSFGCHRDTWKRLPRPSAGDPRPHAATEPLTDTGGVAQVRSTTSRAYRRHRAPTGCADPACAAAG